MTALSQTAYATFARTRMDEARRAVLGHVVCAYTGVCLGCGRPGPCATLLAARRTLAHYSQRSVNQRPHHYGNRQHAMSTTGDMNTPLAADELRAACLAVAAALDRADRQLSGVADPLSRAGLTRWNDALTDAWQALSQVYSRITEARKLPGNIPAAVAGLLDGLAAAQADAARAGSTAERVRRQLAAAEDRLRRTSAGLPARVVADRWRAAAARLDLATARLAIGARDLDRYAAALANPGQPLRPAALRPAAAVPPMVIAAGARAAGAVLLTAHPCTGWRGLLARLRRQHQPAQLRSPLC